MFIPTTIKSEVINKTIQDASNGRYQIVFVSKVLHVTPFPHFTPPMERTNCKIQPLTFSHTTKTCLVCISIFCPCVMFKLFICGWRPEATWIHLHWSVSHTKVKHWHLITQQSISIELKNYIALNSWMCTKTVQKHCNPPYQIRYINTKISVAACRLGWRGFTIYKATLMN